MATGLTDVLCTEQALWHAVSSRDTFPSNAKDPHPPLKRGSSVTVSCLQTLWVRLTALGPAVTRPLLGSLRLPPQSTSFLSPWSFPMYFHEHRERLRSCFCFPSIPHTTPSTLMMPTGRWAAIFFALDQKWTFLELSPCYLLQPPTYLEREGALFLFPAQAEKSSASSTNTLLCGGCAKIRHRV